MVVYGSIDQDLGALLAINGLALRRDDWSAQISAPGDPMFWLRAERPAPGEVTVTNLMRGAQDRPVAAVALAAALRALDTESPTRLSFGDIFASKPPDSGELIEDLVQITALALGGRPLFVRSRMVSETRGKTKLTLAID